MLGNNLQKGGLPAISGPNTLVLRFPARYNLPLDHCQRPENIARVEEELKKLTGRPWHLRVEAVPGAGPSKATAEDERQANGPTLARQQRLDAMQQPLVKRAIEVMGAQIVDMEEGFGQGAAPAAAPSPAADPQEV
jgi:DNA polymerase-3 subunit gamma/tau